LGACSTIFKQGFTRDLIYHTGARMVLALKVRFSIPNSLEGEVGPRFSSGFTGGY